MSEDSPIHCDTCGKSLGERHFSFAHNVERVEVSGTDEQMHNIIHKQSSTGLRAYCCASCWGMGEVIQAAVLQLQSTYPAFSLATPCSRCGHTVDRTRTHVSYTISEFEVNFTTWAGRIIDSRDFAVLCRRCEDPKAAERVVEDYEVERDKIEF